MVYSDSIMVYSDPIQRGSIVYCLLSTLARVAHAYNARIFRVMS